MYLRKMAGIGHLADCDSQLFNVSVWGPSGGDESVGEEEDGN
jgi:hypothetical protein